MMKKTFAFALCVMFAGMAVLSQQALAARRDLKKILPADASLVVGVDVYVLRQSQFYAAFEGRVLKNVKDFAAFEFFLTSAELDPIPHKKNDKIVLKDGKAVIADGLTEIVLVKRGLDASTQDTSALLMGVFKEDRLPKILQHLPDNLKANATIIKEGENEIYQFAGIFQKDETLYAVSLKDHTIAIALTKEAALGYLERDAAASDTAPSPADTAPGPTEAAPSPADEIAKRIEAVRPDSTVWAVAYLSDERRDQFAKSADADETMLQFLKSVSMSIKLTNVAAEGDFKGADIAIECECATAEAAGFLETALRTLRGKLVTAFDDPVIKDLLNGSSATISSTSEEKKVAVTIKADATACEHLVEHFAALLGVEKPKTAEEVLPSSTGTPDVPPADSKPGDDAGSQPEPGSADDGGEAPAP